MSSQNLFAPILMAFVLVAGFFSLAAVASSAASAGKSVLKARESSRTYQLESTARRRNLRIPLPIGPSYIYYDYPYYYGRGYYPTHIGGYVYYPAYSRRLDPRTTDRCASGRRSCVAKTGYYRGHALPRRTRGARR